MSKGDTVEVLRWIACNKMPWMGSVVYKCDIQIKKTKYGTGATDGKSIFIDPRALESWTRDDLTFLVLHETWHAAMGHCERRGDRDPHIWNVVCDHIINYALSQPSLFGKLPTIDGKPAGIILDVKKYDPGSTPEVLYGIALSEAQKCPQHGPGQKGQKQKGQKGQGGQQGDSGDDGDDGDQDGDGGGQKPGKGQKGGKGDQKGKGKGQQDEDGDDGDDSDDHSHGNSGKPCTCGFPHGPGKGKYAIGDDIEDSPLSPEEAETWRIEKEGEITRAIQEAESRGLVPAGFAEALGMGKPQIPWQTFIQQFCSNAINSRTDYSMRRANSSLLQRGLYAPSLFKPSTHIVMILDTSGSVSSHDLSNAVAEVFAAAAAGAKVTVVECDAQVSQVRSFEPGTPVPTEFRIAGRGGTAFSPALKYVKDGELGEEYDAVIYFTDGYGDNPSIDVAPAKPMIWLTTAAKPAEWGMVINYNQNARR